MLRSICVTVLLTSTWLTAWGQDATPATLSSPIKWGAQTDIASRYVIRGIAFSSSPAQQTRLWLTFGDFSFYVWTNLALGSHALPGQINEIDYGFSHVKRIGKFTVEQAVDSYWYPSISVSPDLQAQAPPTAEYSVRLSRGLGAVECYGKYIVDVGSYRGAQVADVGVSLERGWREAFSSTGVIKLVRLSNSYARAYAGELYGSETLLAFELAITHYLNERMFVRPHVEYSLPIGTTSSNQRLSALGTMGFAVGFVF